MYMRSKSDYLGITRIYITRLNKNLSDSCIFQNSIRFLPLLVLIPALQTSLALPIHPRVELGHYFQSIAFLQDGLHSYTYITFQESFAGIHLYSLLASPLVAIGYIEGGRLISWLAILGSALLLSQIGRSLNRPKAGLIASTVFLATPYTLRFGYFMWPESLSIFFTSLAIYGILNWRLHQSQRGYILLLVGIVFGIANHRWEAVVILPVMALLVKDRHWKHLVIIAAITLFTLIGVDLIIGLQPPATSLDHFLILNTGFTPFFTWEFWTTTGIDTVYGYNPYIVSYVTMMPLGILIAVHRGFQYLRQRRDIDLLLSTWTVSGLSIPFLLPGGAFHFYYLWALCAPVAVGVALLIETIILRLSRHDGVTSTELMRATMIFLAISGSLGILSSEYGMFSNAQTPMFGADGREPITSEHGVSGVGPDESKLMGKLLRVKYNVDETDDVVFVGEWPQDPTYISMSSARILAYAQVNLRDVWIVNNEDYVHRRLNEEIRDPIRFAPNESSVSDCKAMVIRNNGQTRIQGC